MTQYRIVKKGTVDAGKIADLVLLDADPLVDIRNTQKIAAVLVKGNYFSRDLLRQILKNIESDCKQNNHCTP